MKTYHLIVIGDEKHNLVKVLKTLNRREGMVTVITNDWKTGIKTYDVVIKLEEDELSLVRLSCNIQQVVVVDDWQKQRDTVNHVGSIIAGM